MSVRVGLSNSKINADGLAPFGNEVLFCSHGFILLTVDESPVAYP